MKVSSRYSVPHEHSQMQSLAALLSEFEVARWVTEIYFDSSVSICFVYFDERVAEDSWVFNRVKGLAEQSITQFEMFGVIYHGIEAG